MSTTQRDTPDWVSQISRDAYAAAGSPLVVGPNATRTLAIPVDSMIHTMYLMFRGVVGPISYSVTGQTTGFVYGSGTAIVTDQLLRIPLATMFDNAALLSVTTPAGGGVTVYIGLTADPEALQTFATIVNNAVQVSGTVGVAGTVTTAATIQNPNIPIAANIISLGTMTLLAGTVQDITVALPSQTTGLYVLTDQDVNLYNLTVFAGTDESGQVLYQESLRPHTRLSIYPLFSGVSPVTIHIGNGLIVTSNFYLYAIVGSLPVITSPIGSYQRNQINLSQSGTVHWQASIVSTTGSSQRFSLTVPSQKILVIDAMALSMDAWGTNPQNNAWSHIIIKDATNTEVVRPLALHGDTIGAHAELAGPIYVMPGFSVIGEAINATTTNIFYDMSVMYHYEVQ